MDEYIDRLPEWQQKICREVRDIVHAADPEVAETIKRSVQPYFVLDGNICALLATKDHVNVFVYDPTVPDPAGLINQGHENATAKAIQIYRDDVINRQALLELFRAVIANNRADGWRKLCPLRRAASPLSPGRVRVPHFSDRAFRCGTHPAGCRGQSWSLLRCADRPWPTRVAARRPGRDRKTGACSTNPPQLTTCRQFELSYDVLREQIRRNRSERHLRRPLPCRRSRPNLPWSESAIQHRCRRGAYHAAAEVDVEGGSRPGNAPAVIIGTDVDERDGVCIRKTREDPQ